MKRFSSHFLSTIHFRVSNQTRKYSEMSSGFENVIANGIQLPGATLEQQQRVLEDLYVPVYEFIKNSKQGKRPLFIGLSAPQGCGKTTLVEVIQKLAYMDNLKCVSMSLDDFYLTGADQDKLAEVNKDNGLLKLRGNAGSHDMPLLNRVLADLSSQSNSSISIPRYDKSLRGGKGDRSPSSEWTTIQGWMLGFSPIDDDDLYNHKAVHEYPGLVAVNSLLGQYKTLHYACDAWIVLALDSVDCVYRWRLEAEHKMIAGGKTGMTDEQVRDFVDRFMPAYHLYLGPMYANGPQRRSIDTPVMMITVDDERKPLNTRFV